MRSSVRRAHRAQSPHSVTNHLIHFVDTLCGFLSGLRSLWMWFHEKLEQHKKRLVAACKLLVWSVLSLANVVLWPYAFMWVSNIHFHWNELIHRMGTGDLVYSAIAALVFPAVAFGLLWRAAVRHQQHASWPTRATASRKCSYLLFFGYAIAATIAANGITSWSFAAQAQVFTAVYLAGGFAVVAVLGTWIADRIGRSIMTCRFNKEVSRQPAVSVLPDGEAVRLVFADGRHEDIPGTRFKDKKEISRLFDNIVTASWQQAQQRILLVTECGDIFTSE